VRTLSHHMEGIDFSNFANGMTLDLTPDCEGPLALLDEEPGDLREVSPDDSDLITITTKTGERIRVNMKPMNVLLKKAIAPQSPESK
jgi:hypothetical protein